MSTGTTAAKPALPDQAVIDDDVRRALAEDVGPGDLTADLIPAETEMQATVISREPAVICGIAWFDAVFRQVDPAVTIEWKVSDSANVGTDQLLCTLKGPGRVF